MPIYEYECSSCHHKFDLMQKMNDAPAKQCPECLLNTAERLVSAASFQLKGTGWYATDFKNKDKPKPATAKKDANAATADKSSTGSSNVASKTKGEKD